MLFLKLFLIFTKIGTFNFGGGYAMLSLIHNETVVKNHWLTNAEFTDIVAISQSTPGPIGINCATYVGYTACLHDGYPTWAACLGSVLASLSIMWLPFIIMILISRYLITHKDSKIVKDIFAGLRPAIIGLIAAAAVLLMNKENFGSPTDNPFVFGASIVLFLAAFYFTKFRKTNPIQAEDGIRDWAVTGVQTCALSKPVACCVFSPSPVSRPVLSLSRLSVVSPHLQP